MAYNIQQSVYYLVILSIFLRAGPLAGFIFWLASHVCLVLFLLPFLLRLVIWSGKTIYEAWKKSVDI